MPSNEQNTVENYHKMKSLERECGYDQLPKYKGVNLAMFEDFNLQRSLSIIRDFEKLGFAIKWSDD